MMTVTKPSANRIDVVLSGILDTDEMGPALDDLIAQSEDVTHGKMLYKILDFPTPTIGAITAEILRMPRLMGLLAKFDQCAVLSNTSWVRTAAEIEGALIPSLAIKSFPLDDTKAAEAWLENPKDDSDDDMAENFPV